MLQTFHLGTKKERGGLEGEEEHFCPRGPVRDLLSSEAAVSGTANGTARGVCVCVCWMRRSVQCYPEPNMGSLQLCYPLS